MRLLWFGEFLISLQWCVIRAPSAKLLLFYKLSLVEQTKVCYQHPGCKRKRLVPLLSCFPLTFSWHYLLRDLIWQDSFFLFYTLIVHFCTQTPKQALDVVTCCDLDVHTDFSCRRLRFKVWEFGDVNIRWKKRWDASLGFVAAQENECVIFVRENNSM